MADRGLRQSREPISGRRRWEAMATLLSDNLGRIELGADAREYAGQG